jgi:hypothetical protein
VFCPLLRKVPNDLLPEPLASNGHIYIYIYIVTNITIATQRFGKHIPEVKQSAVEGPPLMGSKSLGTFLSNGQNTSKTSSRRTVGGSGLSSVRPEL